MIAVQPFKKLLTMSKDAVNEVLAAARAYSAQKKAELKIAEFQEQLASQEKEISELCSNKDIDFDAIIKKMDAYDLTNRRIKQLNNITSQLFPPEV